MLSLIRFVGLAAVLLTAACAQGNEEFLKGSELRQLVTGSEFRYSGALQGNYFRGQMAFNEGGNLYVKTESGEPEGGTWRIAGNELCTRLVALRNGKENCFSVSLVEGNRYKTSHGIRLEGPLAKTD